MKSDIVNPAAPASAQYSKWDEYVAIHLMIQAGVAPGGTAVNFGHGGNGSFSFLSWHRYFLYDFEKALQGYVPSVMLPYWDWSDPGSVMTDTFLGPNGNAANNNVVERGYFAVDKPGAGSNPTPLPAWWPASLNGWRLPAMFPSNFQGGLRRQTGGLASLPTVNDLRITLAKTTYSEFQNVLEAGDVFNSNPALRTSTQMHNGLHGWIGGGGSLSTRGHMTSAAVSPFDPFFYLHHCNIDRLWAMWQTDGHQTEYPTSGGNTQHHRNDIMYPWTGRAAGYGTSAGIASSIPMPDYSALGPKRNVDTLDFRNAFGYTYDTLPVIGIGLDRTGSMNGLTPDPMVTGLPDVTKWEAAKRGVSAFLQDCETVQNSGAIYVMAGIKTFRSLSTNEFTPVFGAPTYGLIKSGTSFSRATFDANVAAVTPGGGTPLADALTHVQNTLVEPPFGGVPADEQRYLAMLTDGVLTTGSPMSSIPDGSLNRTAIFAMGFGTGLDVDYATLASMVAKGRTLATPQVFHGENAGTIDKFFSNALAAAIGFTNIFDPVLELFEGEHTHLSFTATSADDAFYLTAQGMDFIDKNWSFTLHGPNGQVLYGNQDSHSEHAACNHCCQTPDITARRANGRLSMIIQRGNVSKACWVGHWELMISYKARQLDKMMMPELGELLFPVSAGPIKGERYVRLLSRPAARKATRNILSKSLHGLDARAVSTNSNNREACHIVVNIYARTNLKLNLELGSQLIRRGDELKLTVVNDITLGSIRTQSSFARLISPAFDLNEVLPEEQVMELVKANEKSNRFSAKFDIPLLLARYEKEKKGIDFIQDEEVKVVTHNQSPLHIHHAGTRVKGIYHVGIVVDGLYFPEKQEEKTHDDHHAPADTPADEAGNFEAFSRLLTISFSVA
ncbi:hypothetical protein GCM10023189_20290 [Nibrella saemangeumensis]|uniref:VWFA domain-containing protein n=1 Tax=Nibrella saemangeumensis TaxID=1084526 RepID=A0ABP8MTV3_9BACT